MTEAAAQRESPPAPAVAAEPGGKLSWLAWAGLVGLWVLLIDQLRLEWSTNPDYSYGFVVPLLALYLFALRWQSWQPAVRATADPVPQGLWYLLGFLAFLLLPVRLIQVAQPEWRFVGWGMAAITIGISLGLFRLRGGQQWARHIAFPILFVFTAVPWPTLVEVPFTQSLMKADTAFAVFLFNWAGIPAHQVGSLIQAGRETVDVSEACSGIRSLQVTWMSAWFLGEMYRFRAAGRILLVALGVAVALICNLGRTCLLAWLSVSQGGVVMEKWHDPVGLAVLAVSLGSLWGLSTALNPARAGAPAANPVGVANPGAVRPWPRGIMIALGGWLLFVLACTEMWYRSHDVKPSSSVQWDVHWPQGAPGFREIEINPRTRSMLKYTEGSNVSWEGDSRGGWTAFYFRWAPGRTSAVLAHSHHPEACLTAIGCKLQRKEPTETFLVHGVTLPFHRFRFERDGRPLYVWWCLWDEEQQAVAADTRHLTYRGILEAVLRGRRNLGQQILEVILSGVEEPDVARAEMARLLPRLIVQKSGPATANAEAAHPR